MDAYPTTGHKKTPVSALPENLARRLTETEQRRSRIQAVGSRDLDPAGRGGVVGEGHLQGLGHVRARITVFAEDVELRSQVSGERAVGGVGDLDVARDPENCIPFSADSCAQCPCASNNGQG